MHMIRRDDIKLKVIFEDGLSEYAKSLEVVNINDTINDKYFLLYFYTGDSKLNVITLAAHLTSVFETSDGYYASVRLLDTQFGDIVKTIIDTYYDKEDYPMVVSVSKAKTKNQYGYLKIWYL